MGEVGKVGVAIDSIEDMERLFAGIDLDEDLHVDDHQRHRVDPAGAVRRGREAQGADVRKLSGTVQNDVLKEYIARGTYIYPPQQAMRIITDMFAWANENVPEWNTISISGYHMREAGSTAVQEVAFTLGNGMTYVQAAIDAGLDVDKFAPRLSFFFNAHNNFLEEVAKFRAARRMWARIMRDHFKAKNPQVLDAALPHPDRRLHPDRAAARKQHRAHRDCRPWRRCSAGRSRCTPIRSTKRWRCPPSSRRASRCARSRSSRYESGVPQTIDPLAGSYYIESLTNEIEKRAHEYLDKIEAHGRDAEGNRARLRAAGNSERRLRISAGGRSRRSRSSSA